MPYRIWIFNQQTLGPFSATALLADIKAAHFSTLCRQYGLDPGLIGLAMDHLAVEQGVDDHVPYFLVWYQPRHQPPIIVNRWHVAEIVGNHHLTGEVEGALPPSIRSSLMRTQSIFSVSLEESQLYNLGLLLAYEIARWVASRGSGYVLGLDGAWYRLNAHQAFIPIA